MKLSCWVEAYFRSGSRCSGSEFENSKIAVCLLDFLRGVPVGGVPACVENRVVVTGSQSRKSATLKVITLPGFTFTSHQTSPLLLVFKLFCDGETKIFRPNSKLENLYPSMNIRRWITSEGYFFTIFTKLIA